MCAGFYDVGGFSTVIEKLANEIINKGHQVTIGALWFKHYPPKGSYNVVRLPINNPLKLYRFIESFDIVHSHHPITNYLALFCHVPFVYHYHGTPTFGADLLPKLSLNLSILLTKHRLSTIMAVSEIGVAELKKCLNINNINLIDNGVDLIIFNPEVKAKFRRGNPQFLFIGKLYTYKNVEMIIYAMKEVIKIFPEAHFQIVGDGVSYKKLKKLINRLSLEQSVSLCGFVSHNELPYYYSSCDVYVTASKCENYPLPLIEAWACGKPVAASSIPAHIKLVTDSKAGAIFNESDLGDISIKMVRTFQNRQDYFSNALIFSKKYDWSIIGGKVLQVYDQILEIRPLCNYSEH